MFARLFTFYILFCAILSHSLAQEEQSQKPQAAEARARIVSAGIAKLQSHLQGAVLSASQARFLYHGRQCLALLDSRQNIKIIYVLPKLNCKEADNLKLLQDFKKELYPFLEENSPWPQISAKDSYGQMLMSHKSNIDNGVLYADSLTLTQYLNSKLGPPQSWKYNRPTWQIIFNNNKSCIEIALDLNRSRMNSIDMRLLGADANIQDYCNTLNPVLGTKLAKSTSYDELKRWRSATGYSTTQLLAAATTQDGWRISTLEYLVKKDLCLRLANSRTLSHGSADSKTWVVNPPYEFPAEELVITPMQREVKEDETASDEIAAPPVMSLTELQELLEYFNSFTTETATSDSPDTKASVSAYEDEAHDDKIDKILDTAPLPLNPKRALRLYIKSLQKEALQSLEAKSKDAGNARPAQEQKEPEDKQESEDTLTTPSLQKVEKEILINAL